MASSSLLTLTEFAAAPGGGSPAVETGIKWLHLGWKAGVGIMRACPLRA
jgi:hypothetical protein